jgi:hypothetical protein
VSPNERFHIENTAGNIILTSTYVGVGTTTPGAKLEVYNGTTRLWHGATSYYTDFNNSNEINHYTSAGVSSTMYLNWVGGAVSIARNAIFANSAGTVGIGNTSPKSKLDVEGVFGVGSKSFTVTTSYTTGLTINLSAHTGVYLRVTLHGDLSSNSAIGYMGEYFIQNGSGGYAEPGVIIREVNNTNSGSVVFSAQIVDPASSGTRDFEIQFKQDSATSSVGSTLIYQIQGTYNSIS